MNLIKNRQFKRWILGKVGFWKGSNQGLKWPKISLLWNSTVLEDSRKQAYKKGHGQEYSVIAWNYGSRVTLLNINNVQRIECSSARIVQKEN